MGILDGFLSGVGEAGLQLTADQRRNWANEEHDARQASIQSLRDQNLLKWQAEAQDKQRQGKVDRQQGALTGIINQRVNPQFDAADQAYAQSGLSPDDIALAKGVSDKNRAAALDAGRGDLKNQRDAYIASGDLDSANILSNINKADDNSEYRQRHDAILDSKNQQLASLREDAQRLREKIGESTINKNNRAGGNLKADDVQKIQKNAREFVSDRFTEENPFWDGVDDKRKLDSAKQNVLAAIVSDKVVSAKNRGEEVENQEVVLRKYKPALDQYDTAIQGKVRERAASLYDKKGSPLEGTVESAVKDGIPENAARTKSGYMDYARNKALQDTDQFQAFIQSQRGTSQPGTRPSSAAPASQQPSSAPSNNQPAPQRESPGILAAFLDNQKGLPNAYGQSNGATNGQANIGDDNVIKALKYQLGTLDLNDPANIPQIIKNGHEKMARVAELQAKYGSQTKLIGY